MDFTPRMKVPSRKVHPKSWDENLGLHLTSRQISGKTWWEGHRVKDFFLGEPLLDTLWRAFTCSRTHLFPLETAVNLVRFQRWLLVMLTFFSNTGKSQQYPSSSYFHLDVFVMGNELCLMVDSVFLFSLSKSLRSFLWSCSSARETPWSGGELCHLKAHSRSVHVYFLFCHVYLFYRTLNICCRSKL